MDVTRGMVDAKGAEGFPICYEGQSQLGQAMNIHTLLFGLRSVGQKAGRPWGCLISGVAICLDPRCPPKRTGATQLPSNWWLGLVVWGCFPSYTLQ